ncbi:chaperonin, putative [Trichomonas vaginalis G3]|uniref:T-complex protein 1 subunit epsilon n=1 Tax=Trichomonas vaginalis (strain ATCC PRA-98 / G3) TaxID=412133 RepID=A2DL09_TRIV3|nr:unfolded protein binding [Trichomonas vaginalis G3]EAY18962.1 chaperonin, putative [Trichomonas vaginalis G3]KAI5532028.1 unfolded protein binding [Trichomonas vaginalis G3]|eukprot:XP_001579948.1 chaperonin [Trichomonas vaginalis G3]
MSLAFDERGNPFIVIRDQGTKERLKGIEALRANIQAATAVTSVLKTSLGPRGLDKMIVSPHGKINVTNDGATIMDDMEVEHQVAKLLVDLSKSMDNEIGDGTTSVVVLTGCLLESALGLLDRGLHPLRIAEGFDHACDVAVKRIEEIAETLDFTPEDHHNLDEVCETTLNSKIVNRYRDELARMAVEAVLRVADLPRKDVNLERIKTVCKVGGRLEDTQLLNGLVIDKTWSHSQMPRDVENAKVAVLTCPFEPPKPKTKYGVTIKSAEEYEELHKAEQQYFLDQIDRLKKAGAQVVMCQWGFDDEANHLLFQNDLPAVRWVLGGDIEKLAITTGARIVQRFEDLAPEKLGTAKICKELNFGTSLQHMLLIEGVADVPCVTFLIRGGNQMMLDEADRSLHDALCVARNLIRDNRIVYGGGSSEIAAAIAVRKAADTNNTIHQYAMKAFADALEGIPQALAGNSGLNPIETVENIKRQQLETGITTLGVDCVFAGTNDMKKQKVVETMRGKCSQFRLATQIAKMVLKIDDVIGDIPI